MATQQMSMMLDELMGKTRNANMDEQRKEMTFEDEDVCRFFLVGFCPNEMFINTKSDLGPCNKMHDEKYRTQYRNNSKYERLGYEEEFMSFLLKMHTDMERKIKRNKDRLKLTQPEDIFTAGGDGPKDAHVERLEERVNSLNEKINEYLAKAEAMGNDGKVEESQEAIRVAERYKTEREQTRRLLLGGPMALQDDVKPMEVCEICGCFLIVGDAQQRIDEHMTGKQHMGYAKIKATLEELQRRKEERRKEERERREKEDKERLKRREKDRDKDREIRERQRRPVPRDNKEKEKDRDRDVDRDRRQSRDERPRDERPRERDRHSSRHSSRSHPRSRSRERDRGGRREESERSRRGSRERSRRSEGIRPDKASAAADTDTVTPCPSRYARSSFGCQKSSGQGPVSDKSCAEKVEKPEESRQLNGEPAENQ